MQDQRSSIKLTKWISRTSRWITLLKIKYIIDHDSFDWIMFNEFVRRSCQCKEETINDSLYDLKIECEIEWHWSIAHNTFYATMFSFRNCILQCSLSRRARKFSDTEKIWFTRSDNDRTKSIWDVQVIQEEASSLYWIRFIFLIVFFCKFYKICSHSALHYLTSLLIRCCFESMLNEERAFRFERSTDLNRKENSTDELSKKTLFTWSLTKDKKLRNSRKCCIRKN